MDSFSADITAWVNKANGNINACIRKIAFDLGAQIIMRTPVDTGRARANWLLGIGVAQTQTIDKTDEYKESVNDTGAGHASAKTTLLEGLERFDALSGQSIFITNSVPYIGKLEYGSSKQAPAGMIRVTVSGFQEAVRKAVRDIN